MSETTRIDDAHDAMQADPQDADLRLRFYERLAESELFVMLTQEAAGEQIEPAIFDVTGGRFVLAFDREERLSQFAGDAVPYAALSGRVIAQTLSGQGLGLGLNLDVAPSSILIPARAVEWLASTTAEVPKHVETRIVSVSAPIGLPEPLLAALDAKLATAAGLARAAYLVGVTYDGGGRAHMLGFVDAVPGARDALARATGEALSFSGIEAGMIDVGFFDASDTVAAKLARVGLRFDLPQPQMPETPLPSAPGRDPNKPPILK